MSIPEDYVDEIRTKMFNLYKQNLRLINPAPENKDDTKYIDAVKLLEETMFPPQISETETLLNIQNKRKTRRNRNKNRFLR